MEFKGTREVNTPRERAGATVKESSVSAKPQLVRKNDRVVSGTPAPEPVAAPKAVKPKAEAKPRRVANPDRVHTIRPRGSERYAVVDVSRYVKSVSASGNRTLDNGDDVANALRGMDLDTAYAFVAKKMIENEAAAGTPHEVIVHLKSRYGSLNPGMQRMNLGNKLRGVLPKESAPAQG